MVTQQKMANAIRFLSVDMIETAKSGHPGMPLGMADVATVLFQRFFKFDATNPDWFDKDRLCFSNGHGSALLYSLFYLMGVKDVSLDQLKKFRQKNSKTPGHPEVGITAGVDMSAGPLGQGLGAAVGMALAERVMNARWGDALIDHKTYAFVGDGCLMEGISEEAIALAGHLGLNKLIVLWDDNHITIDGPTKLATSTSMKKRFLANKWNFLTCNGHDFKSIEKALRRAQISDKPTLIDCKTMIGYGAPTKAGSRDVHGSPLGADEVAGLRKNLCWPYKAFEIPTDILTAWRAVGAKNEGARQQWKKRVENTPNKIQFNAELSKKIPKEVLTDLKKYTEQVLRAKPVIATRKSSQSVLSILTPYLPHLVGGSADLDASTFVSTPSSQIIENGKYNGNFINYGVREHGMAAVMNGMAAHGGIIPYGSTFLVFADYMKPAMRLAALMQQKIIYVMTHDSIGAGEDGPSHQPVEQLVSLRATPNMRVFRPADGVEVAECYWNALNYTGPSVISLTRQNIPTVRNTADKNLSAQGGYILVEADKKRDVTLIATGSEVHLAVVAKEALAKKGIAAAVVSMPCMEMFNEQSAQYQNQVLGDAPRIAIEAASSYSWHRYIGDTGAILSIDTFGQSAPGSVNFETFGFTPENIVNIVNIVIEGLKIKEK